jgi:hypothetical protein
VNRHGVHDFVRNHDAAEALGQALDPSCPLSESCALALAERGTGLQYQVLNVELGDQRLCQRARAGAELEHGRRLELSDLPCKSAGEKSTQFRCGNEISRGAELRRRAAVISLQRELHEARKRDPAAVLADLGRDAGEHRGNLP